MAQLPLNKTNFLPATNSDFVKPLNASAKPIISFPKKRKIVMATEANGVASGKVVGVASLHSFFTTRIPVSVVS